jgi:hypothetical protein
MTLLLEAGEAYEELRGATIYAEAELVKDVDRVHDLHMAVLTRNTDIPVETLDQVSRGMAPKKTAIVVKVKRCFSWDHRKLGGIY